MIDVARSCSISFNRFTTLDRGGVMHPWSNVDFLSSQLMPLISLDDVLPSHTVFVFLLFGFVNLCTGGKSRCERGVPCSSAS